MKYNSFTNYITLGPVKLTLPEWRSHREKIDINSFDLRSEQIFFIIKF